MKRARRHASGLTLIELMVALAIVAVLGVISYRAVAAAADSRQRLSAQYQRWSDISRCVQMMDNDLLQIVARPNAPSGTPGLPGNALQFTTSGTGAVELSFIKLDGARSSARRVGYRFDGARLVLLRWPGTDAVTPPREDVVLENVKGLRFAFLSDARWLNTWPPVTPTASALPAAVEINLEPADAGNIRRVIALR
jgi:general secretion pathway protein J